MLLWDNAEIEGMYSNMKLTELYVLQNTPVGVWLILGEVIPPNKVTIGFVSFQVHFG